MTKENINNIFNIKGLTALFLSAALSLGYPGIIFFMALESCALPVPSEAVLGIAGFLSGEGRLNFYLVVLSATIGTIIGSSILYYIGKKGGRLFVQKYGRYIFINKQELGRAERWFEKYGTFAVLIGILMPVIKTYIGFPAGMSLMNYKKFAVSVIIGSTIYNIIVAYMGLILGKNIGVITPYFRNFGLFFFIIFVFLIIFYLYKHVRIKR